MLLKHHVRAFVAHFVQECKVVADHRLVPSESQHANLPTAFEAWEDEMKLDHHQTVPRHLCQLTTDDDASYDASDLAIAQLRDDPIFMDCVHAFLVPWNLAMFSDVNVAVPLATMFENVLHFSRMLSSQSAKRRTHPLLQT